MSQAPDGKSFRIEMLRESIPETLHEVMNQMKKLLIVFEHIAICPTNSFQTI